MGFLHESLPPSYLGLPEREQAKVYAYIHDAADRKHNPREKKTFEAMERFRMRLWDPEGTCETRDLTPAQYERYRKALCIILAVDEKVETSERERYG